MKVDVDPDDIQKRTTDDRGRVYLGTEYANSEVELAVLDADRDDPRGDAASEDGPEPDRDGDTRG